MKIVRTKEGISYFWPFVLVTSLFFLWGFAHSILDVLNKHFQEVLVISKAKSALIQAVVYGGYFLMALPAGYIIKRYGYRKEWYWDCCFMPSELFCLSPAAGSCLLSFPFLSFHYRLRTYLSGNSR